MKKVTKINARGNSCNFCDRGTLSKVNVSLIFPYDMVYQVEAEKGLKVRFCPDCLIKLGEYIEKTEIKVK